MTSAAPLKDTPVAPLNACAREHDQPKRGVRE